MYKKLPTSERTPRSMQQEEDEKYEKMAKQMKMRAVSFESYSFISALLFGFSCMAVKWDNGDYTVFRDAQLSREEDKMIVNTNSSATASQKKVFYLSDDYVADFDSYEVIFLAHMFCMTLCCSLSIYSTMVFAMCSVYVRTGLAIGRLDALVEFLADCAFQRNCAFKAFLGGASLLPGDIILVTFANLLQHGHGMVYIIFLLLPATFVATASGWHIKKIMDTATNTVFAFPPPTVTAGPEEEYEEEDAPENTSDRASGLNCFNCAKK